MRLFWHTAFLISCSIAAVADRVTDWLDDLPLPQDTAERWARDGGLKGGEAEFLSKDLRPSLKNTGGGGGQANVDDRVRAISHPVRSACSLVSPDTLWAPRIRRQRHQALSLPLPTAAQTLRSYCRSTTGFRRNDPSSDL